MYFAKLSGCTISRSHAGLAVNPKPRCVINQPCCVIAKPYAAFIQSGIALRVHQVVGSWKVNGMKPNISAIIASALLVTGCGDWDAASHSEAPPKNTLAEPASKANQVYGVFLKAREGKTRFETAHGHFNDLEACQEIVKSYNDGTFDARLPGVYACEPVSGAAP